MTSNPLRGLIASSGLLILAVAVACAVLGGGPKPHAAPAAAYASPR